MAKKRQPMKFKRLILKYRGMVFQVFALLCLFLIGIIIYNHFNPFTIPPSIERRMLFVLIPLGLLTIALYFPYSWAATRLKSLRLRWVPSTLQPIFGWAAAGLKGLGTQIDISRLVNKGISIMFLALLILVMLEAVFNRGFLQDYQIALIVTTIISGALALWLNRGKIDLEAETKREDLEEAQRKKEFGDNFPRINKIPVMRGFVRWVYKEGWFYSLGLILLAIIGLGLRLWNLGRLGLWWDEEIVYMPGKAILETGLPYLDSGFLYLRDLPHLYTTALSLIVFGGNEFALRLPSVLFGIALIVVIYWLSKEIVKSKNVALLASAFVAFHYWFLEFSRWGRSYIMVALLVSLSILFFYKGFVGNSRKYMLLFALTAFVSAMTHVTGQIVLLLFLLLPFFSKGKLKNVFQLRYVLPFFTTLSGIVLYRFLFSRGYYPSAYQQQLAQPTSFWEGLISQFPLSTPDIHNLEIFNVVTVFWVFAAISVTTNAYFILSRKNNYPTGLKYLNYALLIFLLYILFSEKSVTNSRWIFFTFPLVTVLFCTTLASLIKLIAWRRIYYISIFLIAAVLLANSIQIPLRDYGDSIVAKYAPFAGLDFYPDNKTPAIMLNDLYKDGDIVLVYGNVISSYAYFLNYTPTYKIWREDSLYYLSDDGTKRDIYTGIEVIISPEELLSVLENKSRIWAITTYSTLSYNEDYPMLWHIRPWTWKALYERGFFEVYRSKDGVSRLLFKDNTRD